MVKTAHNHWTRREACLIKFNKFYFAFIVALLKRKNNEFQWAFLWIFSEHRTVLL